MKDLEEEYFNVFLLGVLVAVGPSAATYLFNISMPVMYANLIFEVCCIYEQQIFT